MVKCLVFFALILQPFLIPFVAAQKGTIGFGNRSLDKKPCLVSSEYESLKDSLQIWMKRFPSAKQEKQEISFQWPVRWASGAQDNKYYGISNFLDNLPAINSKRDFFCGTRTYDIPGYNHTGTDIFLWPAYWRMMAEGRVDVVAAARGVIVSKVDGNFDQQCVWTNAAWNVIVLKHNNMYSSIYGHLKKNSLTTKAVGDTVEAGEYLGKVGSSGRSNGPHLHFEVNRLNQAFDPWTGNCNPGSSSWENQRPYFDPIVSRMETTSGLPLFPPCPQPESYQSKDTFEIGDTVFITQYFRDLRSGDSIFIQLKNQSGISIDSIAEATIFPEGYFDCAYWTWYFILPPGAPAGRYYMTSRFYQNRDTCFFYYNGTLTSESGFRADDIPLIKKLDSGLYELTAGSSQLQIILSDCVGRLEKWSLQPNQTMHCKSKRGICFLHIQSEAGGRMVRKLVE